jgi:centrosomal protein CEP41
MHDERDGTHYAKLLFEKGFDNVYLLSGGIDKFLETHHECIEGTNVPEKPKVQVKKTKVGSSTTSSVMGKTKTSLYKK